MRLHEMLRIQLGSAAMNSFGSSKHGRVLSKLSVADGCPVSNSSVLDSWLPMPVFDVADGDDDDSDDVEVLVAAAPSEIFDDDVDVDDSDVVVIESEMKDGSIVLESSHKRIPSKMNVWGSRVEDHNGTVEVVFSDEMTVVFLGVEEEGENNFKKNSVFATEELSSNAMNKKLSEMSVSFHV